MAIEISKKFAAARFFTAFYSTVGFAMKTGLKSIVFDSVATVSGIDRKQNFKCLFQRLVKRRHIYLPEKSSSS